METSVGRSLQLKETFTSNVTITNIIIQSLIEVLAVRCIPMTFNTGEDFASSFLETSQNIIYQLKNYSGICVGTRIRQKEWIRNEIGFIPL